MKKRITGIVLAALGALFLLIHVFDGTFSNLSADGNGAELLGGYSILLIVGIILIITGKGKGKNNNQ